MMTEMEWDPIQFFRSAHRPSNPFAILILNQPINESALAVLRRHGELLTPVVEAKKDGFGRRNKMRKGTDILNDSMFHYMCGWRREQIIRSEEEV